MSSGVFPILCSYKWMPLYCTLPGSTLCVYEFGNRRFCSKTCKAGLFFAWSTCTFFWLVIFLRVLYLLLMFKRYESAGVVLCCDAFSILFKYIYFQILMIFFYEKMAVIYTLYNTCGRAFAGEYQCGIRLYCLMQYILTKNNHILGNFAVFV